jgi:hypothetical protein
MNGIRRYLISGLGAIALPVGLVTAAPATAECTNAGAATVCAQGTVRGGGPDAPTAGPYVPYDCGGGYDFYCNDWDWDVDLSPGWRPGGGGGGGGRPGGGGGGIGPR